MEQTAINQRIKFLIDSLSDSVRAFSLAIGEKLTNTSNYANGRNKPSAEFLERIVIHFESVNSQWLLTGVGEPFKNGAAPTQNQTNISGSGNNVASGKNGKAIQKNYNLADCEKERDGYKVQLDKAQREIELLIGQLQMQETIIKGKDEILDLLRGGVSRPN
jgi:hypothetical protein